MTEQTVQTAQRYYMRRELGLCISCGAYLPDASYYVTCDECREKARNSGKDKKALRREYMRQWREKEKAMLEQVAKAVQNLVPTEELKSDRHEIPVDHKCWKCEWSRFHGDRFFCPLVGCIKSKQEDK